MNLVFFREFPNFFLICNQVHEATSLILLLSYLKQLLIFHFAMFLFLTCIDVRYLLKFHYYKLLCKYIYNILWNMNLHSLSSNCPKGNIYFIGRARAFTHYSFALLSKLIIFVGIEKLSRRNETQRN